MLKKRIIAVVMLISLWCGTAAGAFASMVMMTRAHAAGDRSSSNSHSCCPRVHPLVSPALFVAVAGPVMPCGDEHPCCAKRTPQSPAIVPEVNESDRPAPERIAVRPAAPGNEIHGDKAVHPFRMDLFLPSRSAQSTVLRI